MALTKTQRAILEEAARKLEKGPGRGWGEPSPVTREPYSERDVRLWAESWVLGPVRAVLANDAGEISSGELSRLR